MRAQRVKSPRMRPKESNPPVDFECETNRVFMLWFQDTGLHYDRYLREVIEYLEKDPHFKEKLKNANMDDIKVQIRSRRLC